MKNGMMRPQAYNARYVLRLAIPSHKVHDLYQILCSQPGMTGLIRTETYVTCSRLPMQTITLWGSPASNLEQQAIYLNNR